MLIYGQVLLLWLGGRLWKFLFLTRYRYLPVLSCAPFNLLWLWEHLQVLMIKFGAGGGTGQTVVQAGWRVPAAQNMHQYWYVFHVMLTGTILKFAFSFRVPTYRYILHFIIFYSAKLRHFPNSVAEPGYFFGTVTLRPPQFARLCNILLRTKLFFAFTV